jgi:hypothetical protein
MQTFDWTAVKDLGMVVVITCLFATAMIGALLWIQRFINNTVSQGISDIKCELKRLADSKESAMSGADARENRIKEAAYAAVAPLTVRMDTLSTDMAKSLTVLSLLAHKDFIPGDTNVH